VYAADLHGTGQPDLIATTGNGDVVDWPGAAAAGGTATFAGARTLGNTGPAGGQVAFAEGPTVYPDGSTWSTAKTTMTLDEGVVTLTDTATGALLKTFGTGGHPNAYLTLGTDGDLEVRDGGTATWSTGTSGAGETLQLQASGDLALVSSTGTTLWHSNTAH
jgi:DNA-binding beta-propeller fold protein YncE